MFRHLELRSVPIDSELYLSAEKAYASGGYLQILLAFGAPSVGSLFLYRKNHLQHRMNLSATHTFLRESAASTSLAHPN